MLEDKLRFIQRFYSTASEPFSSVIINGTEALLTFTTVGPRAFEN